jgi:hypothetical protein
MSDNRALFIILIPLRAGPTTFPCHNPTKSSIPVILVLVTPVAPAGIAVTPPSTDSLMEFSKVFGSR